MGDRDSLLERERELAVLEGALSDAQRLRGRSVLIEASGGLGKTSLLSEVDAIAAGSGFARLRARADELERDFAYGCVRQLLEPEITRASEAERDRLFAGAATLARPLFAPGSLSTPQPPDSAFSVLHGLYWLLNNRTAEGPVVLLIDDLHSADVESVRLLSYLAPRLDGLALAVVGAHRSGEGNAEELARLGAAPETTVLHPRELSADATAVLCRRRFGPEVDPSFSEACRAATGGNPFFLDALVREVSERGLSADADAARSVGAIGPREVARAVRLRLSDQPATLALLRAVAVLGERVPLGEAAGVAGLDDDEASEAADALVALALLERSPELAFAHPILREAVYGDLPPGERLRAHARAASTLVQRGAAEERIAAQILAAQPSADAGRVELLRRVAADALCRGAPSAAVTWLGRALAEPPPVTSRGEVLLELSLAKLRLGTPEAAVGDLALATDLVGEPQLVARGVRTLAEALTWAGKADAAVAALDAAIASIGPADREPVLLLEAERAACSQLGDREVRARVVTELERFSDLQGDTPGERLLLGAVAYERAKRSESADEAASWIEGALAGHRLLDEQDADVAGTLYLLLISQLATDSLDVIDASLERMLDQAERRASIPAQAFCIVHRGWVTLRRGAIAHAETDARTALELLTSYDIPLGTRYATALLVNTLLEGGEVDAAERALRDGGAGEELPLGPTSNALLESRAQLRLAQGRTKEALDDLIAFGRHDEVWGSANPLASRWRSQAALALAALGEAERSRAMAAEDVERAERWGASSGIGVAARTAALVEGGEGAIDRLGEAVRLLDGSPARLEHARALTELGSALRRANRRAEGRRSLEPALRIAERLGARALADRTRVELSAAGGRSSDPQSSGVGQLTASERRVAELAARGRSNPEIAQALFVTRKTVETHLGRVYRKLDIAGRGELPRELDVPASPTAP